MSAYKSQTIAYQFTAQNGFDGSTNAPTSSEQGEESQFYEGAAEEIGLFPVNEPKEGQPTTSQGNRWLTWYELRLSAAAPAGSKIELVDNTSEDGSPVVLKELQADIEGETIVYVDAGELVPQGAVVRVTAPGVSGVFRYHVTFLDPQGVAMLASLAKSTQKGGGSPPSTTGMIFSDEVADAGGTTPLSIGVIERYDASALAGDELKFTLPANPVKDQETGIKEVGNSSVAVELIGNGNTVETATAAAAATQSTGVARQSLTWKFDGAGVWRLV